MSDTALTLFVLFGLLAIMLMFCFRKNIDKFLSRFNFILCSMVGISFLFFTWTSIAFVALIISLRTHFESREMEGRLRSISADNGLDEFDLPLVKPEESQNYFDPGSYQWLDIYWFTGMAFAFSFLQILSVWVAFYCLRRLKRGDPIRNHYKLQMKKFAKLVVICFVVFVIISITTSYLHKISETFG